MKVRSNGRQPAREAVAGRFDLSEAKPLSRFWMWRAMSSLGHLISLLACPAANDCWRRCGLQRRETETEMGAQVEEGRCSRDGQEGAEDSTRVCQVGKGRTDRQTQIRPRLSVVQQQGQTTNPPQSPCPRHHWRGWRGPAPAPGSTSRESRIKPLMHDTRATASAASSHIEYALYHCLREVA